ncbi:hypothetical protein A3A93_04510 [Candidatus Roizmanbacteria bacterium RIFCSPLOWO2_01_FULL_38_12]|uniref:Glycosyltransferase RgtA/B/C/D-like domain-containing protein n=1 Tax=Candidatus Roizmanbacteria bacterium RIFCSPLOWO2_01_FULL_38_12 TaxID=1802061 RepID=A0A1F7IXG0_9BACT|nr:MAG: hypothetical protein A2861_01980 [Candidatus Roizmanbacteria bacterium RIFCSPHIGHO2_01_FULL_38_15]OGK35501.1 MAG: hypothetical protein A3F59_01010 [Candidatus Roizmanbacteria bacterium RIFCSPHIGHO2_12_FULL_38_13]OGK48031.1 MAG: hypothetical protein A3A93_04510 [Candidatus Roizmanbacteria bacterium RIFCSPLOWO2_01_FULL_38_12]
MNLCKYSKALLIFALSLLIISRFILLDRSARFIWDETDDLRRMKEIYENRRLTLVGPISGNNINIYGSLSYYMLMPFAVAYDFDPIGPVVGTATYSVIIILLLSFLLSKKYSWQYPFAILFLAAVFPLVQSGRWAWNPHYIPFWQVLSLTLLIINYKNKSRYLWVLAGLLQGLSIHNHWYAFFSVVGFSIALFILFLREKRLRQFWFFVSGVLLAILPFVVFDIMRPPGLFISRFLYFSPVVQNESGFNILNVLQRIFTLPYQFLYYFFQNHILTILFIPIFLFYLVKVIRGESLFKKLLLIPIAAQIIGLSIISTQVFDHYFISAVIFFILFLAIPDEKLKFSKNHILLLLIFIMLSIPADIYEVTKNEWDTNIKRSKAITDILAENIEVQRCNVIAIASKDSGITAKRYRDMLALRDVYIMGHEEYRDYECLFVVSTSDLNTIKKDPVYELDLVRNISPVKVWNVEGDWKVYKFVVD